MIRKIIKINEELCNGCGACANACHEGAIGMVNNKAKLLRDDYCDGLGNCLPVCPTGAITFEEREAAAFDEEAVNKKNEQESKSKEPPAAGMGCPGSRARIFEREENKDRNSETVRNYSSSEAAACESELRQWPVQIKLAPVNAPYFKGANLLIAADCTAYAYGNFHRQFMHNRVTLIGCPKLDAGDYSEKLTEIIRANDIKSVTIVRMEVPCCGGIEFAAKQALQNSGKFIPWQVVTISTDGRILE